jgi:predicted DNA-binding transcriptional regulator YafY
MNIKNIIKTAADNRHTLFITAREKDNSVESREVEPYSYRYKDGNEIFYCYDINKNGTRCFIVPNILSVSETDNIFSPRWPIEI